MVCTIVTPGDRGFSPRIDVSRLVRGVFARAFALEKKMREVADSNSALGSLDSQREGYTRKC